MLHKSLQLLLTVAVVVCGALAQSQANRSGTCSFQPVQIGQDYTSVYGITSSGIIVGTYNPNPSPQSGFTLNHGTVTSIAYPGAAFTSAYGMSDNGTVVGTYAVDLFSAQQGYSWTNGTFTSLTYPASLATYPTGVNKSGVVVGTYQDSQGISHGFVYASGSYSAVDYPGAQSTLLSQVNNNGVMVGSFLDSANGEHGFIDEHDTLREINYPGASNTVLTDINDKNQVSGTYYNNSYTTYHGFLWINGQFQSVSDPGNAGHTALSGINNSGVLVGNLDSSGSGFKAIGCVASKQD